MKSLSHLIGVCAILMLAIAFTNCTTDSEVTQVSENELESEDISSSSSAEKVEKATTKAKSSSSKKEVLKSSDSKKSSASKEDSKKDSSKSKSSSSVKKDSNKVSSSSKKEEAKSSSSAKKIHVPGMEDTQQQPPKEVVKPDSTKTPKDTSAAKDTIKTDTTTVVSEEDKDEKMEQLDPDELKEIEELIENGDSTVTEIENPDKVNTDDLDFDNNEYYCKAPDGSWYRLKENKAKTFWKLLWDITVYIFTGHHWYDFTNVCDEMYMRPKSH